MQEHTLTVARTARYYTLGGTPLGGTPLGGTPLGGASADGEPVEMALDTIRNIWFVLHGYGQLAQYFIRRFDVVADADTLVVAPEGLSRMYLDKEYGKIGASWITREARDHEIADYVAYLNHLYETILAERDPDTLHVTVLGFSQGAATACRWLNGGHIRADRLILWAGFFANGLAELIDLNRLTNVPVHYVYGDQDEYLTKLPDPDAYQQKLLADIPTLELIPFKGRHQIDRDVLRQLR